MCWPGSPVWVSTRTCRPGSANCRTAGYRLVTLSNGATEVADRLLTGAGLRGELERLLWVEDAGVWKPAPREPTPTRPRMCGVDPADMMLVAVHPWDIDGAPPGGAAGRLGEPHRDAYPGYFTAPTVTVSRLGELARRIGI